MMLSLLPRIAIGIAAASRSSAFSFTIQSIQQQQHFRTNNIISMNKSSTTTNEQSASSTSSSLWTDVAINAAKQFTITQRQKLHDLGLLNVQRPIKIIGESISSTCDIGDCVVRYQDHDDIAATATTDINNAKQQQQDDHAQNINNDSSETTKIIHFQRHGQGYHNLICDMYREFSIPIDFDSPDPTKNPVVRPEFLDPPLTALGIEQCSAQRTLCRGLSPELVIVSPMLRCIQTAKLSFRDHDVDTVPWVSHEGCREELGLLVGNKRRRIEDIQVDYPDIDFSAIQHNKDELWDRYGDRRETLVEKSERIYEFLTEYVRNRPEEEIAIVCHSAYLFTLLNAVMDIEEEELRSWFLTSEVRSLKVKFSDSQ